MAIETERKFLILCPPISLLETQPSCRQWQIVQTYLQPTGQTERRIRSIREKNGVRYVYTEKSPIPGSKISRNETERELSLAEYNAMLTEAVSALTKTRFAFPYGEHTVEIDVYPPEIGGDALAGLAVLEVELGAEDEDFTLPAFITVVRELTGTKEFSNKALAKPVRH